MNRNGLNLMQLWLYFSQAKSELLKCYEKHPQIEHYRRRDLANELQGVMNVLSGIMASEREKAA
jgi:hypothetical protein